jgi:hypothetical protein
MKHSTNSASRLLTGLLGLSWLALITTLYFVSHKPFNPDQALVFAQAVYQFLIALGLLVLGGGLGLRITQPNQANTCGE